MRHRIVIVMRSTVTVEGELADLVPASGGDVELARRVIANIAGRPKSVSADGDDLGLSCGIETEETFESVTIKPVKAARK